MSFDIVYNADGESDLLGAMHWCSLRKEIALSKPFSKRWQPKNDGFVSVDSDEVPIESFNADRRSDLRDRTSSLAAR